MVTKSTLKILIFLFFFGICISTSFSQTDYLANVLLKQVVQVAPNQLEFNLQIVRNSDIWLYWVNGSYEFALDSSNIKFDSTNYSIELLPNTTDTSIVLGAITGSLPTVNYIIVPRIFNNRISIMVNGPQSYQYCALVPKDTIGLSIGRFRLTRKDRKIITTGLHWLTPTYYYQSCAFKLNNDSLLLPSVTWYYSDNNLEMENGITTGVNFMVEPGPQYITDIVNFRVQYLGQKIDSCSWQTRSEAFVSGFIIVRAVRDYENLIPETDLKYKDTIADYRRNDPINSRLVGLGTVKTGRDYRFYYDTISLRGYTYCYKLLYQDFFGNIYDNNIIDCIRVPNAVIVSATNFPNPYNKETTVDYVLDDDVYLSAYVYDVDGRLVETLMSNQFKKKGHYTDIVFNVSKFAQQGVYDILLVANPILDTSVEYSRAVVKTQYIK